MNADTVDSKGTLNVKAEEKPARPLTSLAVPLALAAALVLLHLLTLRANVTWSGVGDFLNYLRSGMKIFDDWGYLPAIAYPHQLGLVGDLKIIFPALSSLQFTVVHQLGGNSYDLSRIPSILCFGAALYLFFLIARKNLSYANSLILIVVIGLAPYFFAFKEQLRSDLQFLFLLYLCVVLFGGLQKQDLRARSTLALALFCGFVLYLAIGYRSVGVALLPAVIAHDIWRFRTVRWYSLVVVGTAAGLYLLQGTLIGSGAGRHAESLAVEISVLFERAYRNAFQYHYNLQRFIENAVSPVFTWALYVPLVFAAALGYLIRLFRTPTLLEFFLVVYAAGLLISPTVSAWQRYLIPIYAPLILYALIGLEFAGSRLGDWARRGLVTGFLVFLVFNLGSQYALRIPFGELDGGPEAVNAREVYSFLSQTAEPGDVVSAGFPAMTNMIRFETGFPARDLPGPRSIQARSVRGNVAPDLVVWRHLRETGSDFIVLRHSDPPAVSSYSGRSDSFRADRFYVDFVKRNAGSFITLFENGDFVILQWLGPSSTTGAVGS